MEKTVLFKLPKIDLHRHLEGSLRLSTLAEIAQEHAVDLPTWSLEQLRPLVQVVDGDPYDFQGFLNKFKLLRRFYSSREAVLRVTSEAIADAAADNVRYLELRFNPVALGHNQGFSFEDVTDWVIQATHEAQEKHDIQVRLIVQIGRHEPQYAQRLAEIAVSRQQQGIVALDLAGDEITYSAAKFAKVFQWAKGQGLHITVHAAEAGPATNIIEAIRDLGAERIGHGVQARRNDKVIELLRSERITLEMCPTSNLQTGLIPRLSQHPLFAFHQLGIPVTINTDDPSISNTTLTDEFVVANRGIGVPFRELRQMTLNAAEAAFLPDPDKKDLCDRFKNWLDKGAFSKTQPSTANNS
ncbi:MAG: adenosine deaminase [Anaerolineales bacterium]|nr:adenosine deaminase [Anaerolineales bacterium]